MDRNKYYFHHLTSNNITKLVKIKGNCKINIHDNSGQYNAELLVNSNGYYINGKLFTTINIIKDSDFYYIIKNGYNQNESYVNIDISNLSNSNGFTVCDYEEDFDITDYTILNPLNYANIPINKIDESVSADSTFTYTSINRNNQYQSFASIICLTARNYNGTEATGVYLINKVNGSSSQEYTVTPISTNGNISNYSITGTTTGFTISCSTSVSVRYKVVELACGSTVN